MKIRVKLLFNMICLLATSNSLFAMESDSQAKLLAMPELTCQIFLYTIKPILKKKFEIIINKYDHEDNFDFIAALKEWHNYQLPHNNEFYQYLPALFSEDMLQSHNEELTNNIHKMWISLMIDYINNHINREDDLNKALLYGTCIGNIDMVQMAISKNANINTIDTDSQVAIETGICSFSTVHKKICISSCPEKFQGETALIYAISCGHTNIAKLLILNGANINEKDSWNQIALSIALQTRNIDLVDLLIEHNSDIDSKDQCGKTPLMFAAETGRIDIVQLAIDKGLDVNTKSDENPNGGTALIYAARAGLLDIVELLLDNNANINAISMCAAQQGLTRLCKITPNENEAESLRYGETALIAAAQHGKDDVIQFLLQKKDYVNIDTNFVDEELKLAFLASIFNGHASTVHLLLEKGANINAKGRYRGKANFIIFANESTTGLMYAAMLGHKDVVELLVQNGADINITDDNGNTAWTYAMKRGHKDIAKLLNENSHASFSKNLNLLNDSRLIL